MAVLVDAARTGGRTGAVLWWASPTELRVEYLRAETAELTRPQARVAGRVVRVALDGGVAHEPAPTAAAGRTPRGSLDGFLQRSGAPAA